MVGKTHDLERGQHDPDIELSPAHTDLEEPNPRWSSGSADPTWLRALAIVAAAGVLSFGAIGLALAVAGWYRPWLALPLGAAATTVLVLIGREALASPETTDRAAHVVAAIGVAAIVGITAWNASNSAHHVLVNRDGGSYDTTGRWIARHGNLRSARPDGVFANEPALTYNSFAVFRQPDGSLQFQSAHLLPALLAEAYNVGGSRLFFHFPALLSGVALLSFFVLSWRLFRRPLYALSAMLCLAFVLPQVSFSRDSYSEIPTQILLFTALWLMVGSRLVPKWRVALLAGLFLGATEATRIDAIAYLIGLPLLFAIALLVAQPGRDRNSVWISVAAFVSGLTVTLALGIVDLTVRSHDYWSALSGSVRKLFLAVLASLAVAVVVYVLTPRLRTRVRASQIRAVANAGGALVLLAGAFLWFVRPSALQMHSTVNQLVVGLQRAEGRTIDGTRSYYEQSMRWITWYLGPIVVAAAIVAAALLTRELLTGRSRRALAPVLVLGPAAALYIWDASASPDHVWVDRRFLVSAIPLFVLLAFGLAARLAGRRGNSAAATTTRVAALVFAISAVAFPLATLRGVSAMTEQTGFSATVDQACAAFGPRAAVVVLSSPTGLFDQWTPQTFRSWCGADVAILRGPQREAVLQRLATRSAALGRPLYVAADDPATIRAALPDARITTFGPATNNHLLARTLTRRPSSYITERLAISVARVN
ncbi:MAG TPA: hypothetical protein VN636_20150 [Acidimicrobiia bacterium]|nr:hypothetical protein [Acidimicrobiia bacterium]